MKKKLWLLAIPLLLVAAVFLLLQSRGLGFSSGRCLIAENGTVLLIDERGGPVVLSNTRGKTGLFDGLSSGDSILVLHDGVEETYPARTGAYALWKKAEGSLADIPADTLQQLNDLGWSFPTGTPIRGYLEVSDLSAAWANWTDENLLYMSCLNAEKMSISSVQHLPIFKMESAEDLASFQNRFSGVLTFDQGWDEVPSFREVTAEMGEDYFAENTLLLVYVPAGSCSYRFGAESVLINENALCVYVQKTVDPEVVDCAMAGWLLPIPVAKATAANLTEFDAVLGLPS